METFTDLGHATRSKLVCVLNVVGLVSLPGMMTGQILSGIEPLMAARYQIMVMCMIFSTAGLSTVTYMTFKKY